MTLLRIGIFFGGPSREREVAFAGGRTVLHHLDRSLFDPVPIFVDSLGNFILLDPGYLQQAQIRDFYPPRRAGMDYSYQVYLESLGEQTDAEVLGLVAQVGQYLRPADLRQYIDFAFIAMHGAPGEDGSLQGLFEWYGLPYSGPGIFGSAVGMDKPLQNELIMQITGMQKRQLVVSRQEWEASSPAEIFAKVKAAIGLPIVAKAPHGGSSIGVAIVKQDDLAAFGRAVQQCWFTVPLDKAEWLAKDQAAKRAYVQQLAHLDSSIGYPVVFEPDSSLTDVGAIVYHHPQDLLAKLDDFFSYSDAGVLLTSVNSEEEVLFEEFIAGKEFSCGVIEDEDGQPLALPPTGIEAPSFDFQTKYKTSVAKKTMPVDVPLPQLQELHRQVRAVAKALRFGVCARIDGFATVDGRILLHDPNTIPGMSPTSLIFKQMVEIGLHPTHALTYLVRASLQDRARTGKHTWATKQLLAGLDRAIAREVARYPEREKVAVIFGGFVRELEESLLTARQAFAKLAASGRHAPVLVVLSGSRDRHVLHRIPVNLLFKENLEDLKKAMFADKHPLLAECVAQARALTRKYAGGFDEAVVRLSYDELAAQVQRAFVATGELSPSEDGSVQGYLRAVGLPFFGPGVEGAGW
jgi:D-alanine-D-alanine ligase